MTNLKRLLRFVKPHQQRMAGAAAAMGAVAAANFAILRMVEPIIDGTLVVTADARYVRMLAGVLVMLYLAMGIARYLSTYLMGSVGFAVVRDLRVHLYRHLQFLPLDFHASRSTGGLMSRVTSDVLAIQEALTRVLVDLLRESLMLIGCLAVMFYVDWVLALIVLAAAPLQLSALLQETLTGIRVVKAFGMEHAETEKFRRAAERLFRHSLHAERLAAISSPLMEFIGAAAGAAVLLYGSWRITEGALTPGQFVMFLVASFATYAPLRRLSNANVRIQAAAAASERIFEILDSPVEPLVGSAEWPDGGELAVIEAPGTREMPALVHGITFECRFRRGRQLRSSASPEEVSPRSRI